MVSVHQFSPINALIIGNCAAEYLKKLKLMTVTLGIEQNIVWKGVLQSLEDVHRNAVQAKVSVLPTHIDMIPGTIIESMLLGIPVVSYAVGGIPEINESGENILIVEDNDIAGLADKIKLLLENPGFAEDLAQRAKERAKFMFCKDDPYQDLLAAYRQILES